MYRLFILIFCVAASSSHAGEIYKYVDENGNVSYSETPPADSENVQSLESEPDVSEDALTAARERQQKLKAYLDESQAKRALREAENEDSKWDALAPSNSSTNLPPLAGQ